MNLIYILVIIFFAHLLLCGSWFFLGRKTRAEAMLLLPMILCLPVTGILCAVLSSSRKKKEELETPVSKLYHTVEKGMASVQAGRQEMDTVVPFDEIMLLSNDQSRREVMMHILRRDPFLYLEVLKTAKVSSDVEVTHYATTTIIEIQRDLDITMQKAEDAFNASPDNLDAMNRLISAITSYIDTELLLEHRMLQLRNQLSEILEHKLLVFPNSRSARLLLIENDIQLGNYIRAAEIAGQMREKWPTDENSWLKSLRVCMVSGDAEEKTQIASQIKTTPINWSRSGREEAEFLCGSV